MINFYKEDGWKHDFSLFLINFYKEEIYLYTQGAVLRPEYINVYSEGWKHNFSLFLITKFVFGEILT